MSPITKINTTMKPPVTSITTSPTTKANITMPPPPWIITSHCWRYTDEDIPTSLLPPSLQVEDEATVKLKSNEVRIGPITRARAKLLKQQKDKDAADLITWRDYEDLRNEMRREFGIEDDELRGTVQEISQKMDATNETVTTMTDQMTDIQRSLQSLQLAVENLAKQQQQQGEDADEAPGRGDRPRGWAPLGHHGRGLDEEDGLGKPKFSILKFEGGADIEEYLTWELKIEKLWRLHNYTEDREIKLASDGYALRWWDALVRNRQEDGVKTVDEYYMEMESLIQRGRVRESLEMTMQGFLHGLKSCRELGASRLARPHTARAIDALRPYSTPPSKPVSNVSNAKKSESAASTSGSSMSTARNRDMNCHTCGGKGHFKRDCPNHKVMIVNEDNEYETGDDVDPYAPEDDDYDSDGVDAYPSDARTIVVSQRALNVLPSASTQPCNLFQTKALVGPDKACKWLSDNGEMKVNHMVRVEFEIGPYEEEPIIARGGEEQLDKKLVMKLNMEMDVKTYHGRAREEREACARGGDLQADARPGQTGRGTGPSGPSPGQPASTPDQLGHDRLLHLCQPGQHPGSLDA
ncbi:hypothetical protein QYE76_040585 [Lolium multiflorum]|uniref:CCHC-type domain-containing protein n=1 Tax=Lolium multiflorum TaxID=4521 RepID=A0AAD8TD72_LOLMU|nr:hypothetical protein QYE76_040585 [Lolium multiflorum]